MRGCDERRALWRKLGVVASHWLRCCQVGRKSAFLLPGCVVVTLPLWGQVSFSGPLWPHFTWPGCSFFPGGGHRVAVWVAPPVPRRSAWEERRLWCCGWWLWSEGAGAAGGTGPRGPAPPRCPSPFAPWSPACLLRRSSAGQNTAVLPRPVSFIERAVLSASGLRGPGFTRHVWTQLGAGVRWASPCASRLARRAQ